MRFRTSALLAVLGVVMATTTVPATAAAPIPVQVLSLTDLHGYLCRSTSLSI